MNSFNAKAYRMACLEKDNHECVECGSRDYLEADHKQSLSLGGNNELENMQTLCVDCHWDKTLRDFKLLGELKKGDQSLFRYVPNDREKINSDLREKIDEKYYSIINAENKEYKKQNRDRWNEYQREYANMNYKDKREIYQKEYNLKNKEKIRRYLKEYRKKNRDKIKKQRKKYLENYYPENKERIKEYRRKYYIRNKK